MKNLDDILTAYRHKNCMFVEDATNEKVMGFLKGDYKIIIDLRNRIHDSTDEEPPELYEEDFLTLDHILDFLEEVFKGEQTPKRYKVVEDLQGGDFGMGRNFTISQWRKQAMEWCYTDENYGIMKELYETKDEEVLDTIAEIWGIKFTEMGDNDGLREQDIAEFEDETLDDYFTRRFDKEAYEDEKAEWGQ